MRRQRQKNKYAREIFVHGQWDGWKMSIFQTPRLPKPAILVDIVQHTFSAQLP
jgi:hypothetical protein